MLCTLVVSYLLRALASNAFESGECVVYWMSRDQRAEDNWAMLFAKHLAEQVSCDGDVTDWVCRYRASGVLGCVPSRRGFAGVGVSRRGTPHHFSHRLRIDHLRFIFFFLSYEEYSKPPTSTPAQLNQIVSSAANSNVAFYERAWRTVRGFKSDLPCKNPCSTPMTPPHCSAGRLPRQLRVASCRVMPCVVGWRAAGGGVRSRGMAGAGAEGACCCF